MVKILRVRSASSPKTPRGASISGTAMRAAAFFSDAARKRVTSKARVRILHATDPANYLTRDDAVFDQLTNNPNPKYDPSKAPGSVKVLDSTPKPPEGATSGHQKVIPRTLFNQNQGKTLKRR